MPVAIVIGGARRLGRAIALRLAAEGYDVGITYHTSVDHAESLQRQITPMGRAFHSVQADVRIQTALASAWHQLLAWMGSPDVVILCAGVFPERKHPQNVTLDELDDAMRINAMPLVILAQQYEQHCLEHGRIGRMISIGSLGAVEIWSNRLAYNMSKSAARTAALSLARSLAPVISVNIVAPGAIVQPDDVTSTDAALISTDRIPMGRHGTNVDVCDAVMFFATASHYITGQTIYVDGGYGLTR